jgi:glycosyltransferase involved in cell wall biosynthesis
MSLLFERGKLFYLEYNIRLLLFLLFRKVHVVTANDLDTLLGAWLAARIRGKRLVLDAHELFTEVPEVVRRPKVRAVWRWLEKCLLPRVDGFCTVNNYLADTFHERYGRRPLVLPNYPLINSLNDSQQQETTPTLIYQGYLNEGRGLELAIDAMERLPNWELWVVGPGPLTQALRDRAANSAAATRIRFWGPLPFEELRRLTPRAHLGVSLEDPACGANNYFSSPNKIYDYLAAGLPVIVADLPSHRAIVSSHSVGSVCHTRTPEALAQLVANLHPDGEAYIACRANVFEAQKAYSWQANTPIIAQLYATL